MHRAASGGEDSDAGAGGSKVRRRVARAGRSGKVGWLMDVWWWWWWSPHRPERVREAELRRPARRSLPLAAPKPMAAPSAPARCASRQPGM
eukprot:1474655-Prymnesium_polylepis.1